MDTIHDYEKIRASLLERIKRSPLPECNKRLILEFEAYCAAENLTIARRVKLMSQVYVFAKKYFHRPFKGATARDIWKAVLEIESSPYSPWTKHDFKVAIRKFFKFVVWGQRGLARSGMPGCVAGITTRIAKRDRVRVTAADIVTQSEVDDLLEATDHTQRKALYGLMYELGTRVSELGTMRVGSVRRDHLSYVCVLNGKTGKRQVRIIRSAGALTAWLNAHPLRHDPNAPLWVVPKRTGWKRMSYASIRLRLKDLARRAGISKRVYPHLMRHSRTTHFLAGGHLNDAQAKEFLGLTADSDCLAVYSHLVSKDANDAVLRMYGIKPDQAKKERKPIKCGMCGDLNEPSCRFCARCGHALNMDALEEAQSRISNAEALLERFLADPEVRARFKKMIDEHGRSRSGAKDSGQSPRRARPSEEQE